MKTVATFSDPMTASIAKGMLESHGIPSIIDNQAMNSLYPAPMAGVSEVSLSVNDRDFDRAAKLLNEHGE